MILTFIIIEDFDRLGLEVGMNKNALQEYTNLAEKPTDPKLSENHAFQNYLILILPLYLELQILCRHTRAASFCLVQAGKLSLLGVESVCRAVIPPCHWLCICSLKMDTFPLRNAVITAEKLNQEIACLGVTAEEGEGNLPKLVLTSNGGRFNGN
eukprot:Gb_20344 [translate_table: standard]